MKALEVNPLDTNKKRRWYLENTGSASPLVQQAKHLGLGWDLAESGWGLVGTLWDLVGICLVPGCIWLGLVGI